MNTQQEHVNAVAIGDDGGGPCIVIATDGSFLTVIQWRRRSDENNGVEIEAINGIKIDTNDDDIAHMKTETSDTLTIKENIDLEVTSTKSDKLKTEQDKCLKQKDHAGMKNKKTAESKTEENGQFESDKEIGVHTENNSIEKGTDSVSNTGGLLVLNNEMMVQRWKSDMQFAQMTRDDT